MVGVKCNYSSVVIECQVNEFTHTWLAKCFVVKSHIYPGFMGKVSTLNHLPLEPACEDYSFLEQAVADFEHVLVLFSLTPIKTLELDASFDEPDTMPSSVPSGFLCSFSTISDNSKLQLASSIKFKLWCQARVMLLAVQWQEKCQPLN